jgi:hypothetical protein
VEARRGGFCGRWEIPKCGGLESFPRGRIASAAEVEPMHGDEVQCHWIDLELKNSGCRGSFASHAYAKVTHTKYLNLLVRSYRLHVSKTVRDLAPKGD